VPQTQENQAQFFASAAGSVWPQSRVSETWSRGKNSRLGSSSLKTALHRGFAGCNSTTALGLRAGWVETRGGAYRCARYYDPQIGRFISQDPIGYQGGMNVYRYVRNNPLLLLDPSGLCDVLRIPIWSSTDVTIGTPRSAWNLVSYQEGGSDLFFVANLGCHWNREYNTSIHTTTTYLVQTSCVTFPYPCQPKVGVVSQTYSIEKQDKYSTGTTTKRWDYSMPVLGFDSEFLEQWYCAQHLPPR